MYSLIFTTATRYALPMLLILSTFLLLRGHNAPGGGFVGGLVAAATFCLYSYAFALKSARHALGVSPVGLIGIGLLTSLGSGLCSLLVGNPFMKGMWGKTDLPVIGTVGTPVIFDIGVYLVVLGVVMLIVFSLIETPEEEEDT